MRNHAKSLIDVSQHQSVIAGIERVGAERNVLTYILSRPDSIYDVATELQNIDFANGVNKEIYENMLVLMGKNVAINQSTIVAMLKKYGNTNPEKIDEYLDTLTKICTVNMDLKYNIKLVKCASVKRQAYLESLGILEECADDYYEIPVEEFLGKSQQKFLDLSIKVESVDRSKNIGELISSYIEVVSQQPKEIAGIKTGFPQLDYEISGLLNGKLYVVAARPKTGKSVLLSQWASNISVTAKESIPSLYLDTEMNTEEQMSRLIARISGVPERMIVNGMFTQNPEMVEKVKKAEAIIQDGKLWHVYVPNFNIGQLSSLIRKHYIRDGVRVVFFDYIKLGSDSPSSSNEQIELGKIATALKDIAGNLDIPVVTAAQINRKGAGESQMSDAFVAGSDKILQYCNYLFALRNKLDEEIEAHGSENGNQVLELLASRNGGDYKAWLNFSKKLTHVKEILKVAS